MPRQADYEGRLTGGEPAEAIAATDSGLPGPRGNLELIAAIAETAEPEALVAWAGLGSDDVSGDEPRTVLVVAGIVGLGRLLAEGWRGGAGRADLVGRLHKLAADPRWRVREGVAMALQRWASTDLDAAFSVAEQWAVDSPFVQRAAVAAVCEPPLLRDSLAASRALAIVDRVTADVVDHPGRRGADVEALRKALGYGWSVAIVAAPDAGRPTFERWFASDDPAVRWVVRENLRKARLARLDPAWVARLRAQLAS